MDRHGEIKSILRLLQLFLEESFLFGCCNDHKCVSRGTMTTFHLDSMSVCSTASSATFPFREPASALSNSIQPSLKPSSILMRGVGFFMLCDLNSDSQVSRGTGSILTGRPSRSAKVVAISLGVTRCGASNSTTLWSFQAFLSDSASRRPVSDISSMG